MRGRVAHADPRAWAALLERGPVPAEGKTLRLQARVGSEGGEAAGTAIICRDWSQSLSRYEKPDRRKAAGQLLNTLLPYGVLWAAMVWMLRAGLPYWSILPLLVP